MVDNLSGYQQMLKDTAPNLNYVDDMAERITKELLNVKDVGSKTFTQKPNLSTLSKATRFANTWKGSTLAGLLLGPYLKMNQYTWAPDQKLLNEIYKNVGREDLIKDVTKPSPLYKMGPTGAILQGAIEKIINDINNGSNVNNNQTKQEEQNSGNTNINKSSSNNDASINDLPNLPAIANQTLNESPLADATARVPGEDDINIVNDYLKRLQDARKPYEELLSNYVNNFDANLDDYRRARKFYTGLAGWSGNRAFSDLAQDYNPFTINTNRLALAKQLYDENLNNMNAVNELQGNIALAKEMDLPAEAAFGNKNLLTALSQAKKYATDLEKARIMDAMRRYGYDVGYRRAIDTQNLRNQGNANVAGIYMGGGLPGVGLTPQGTAQQQQSYNPIQNKFDKYEGK